MFTVSLTCILVQRRDTELNSQINNPIIIVIAIRLIAQKVEFTLLKMWSKSTKNYFSSMAYSISIMSPKKGKSKRTAAVLCQFFSDLLWNHSFVSVQMKSKVGFHMYIFVIQVRMQKLKKWGKKRNYNLLLYLNYTRCVRCMQYFCTHLRQNIFVAKDIHKSYNNLKKLIHSQQSVNN